MTTRVHVKILKPVRDTKHGLDVSPGEHILSSIGFGRLRQAAPDALVVVGVEPDGKPLVKAPTLDDVKGTMPKRTEPPLDGIELAAMDLAARAIVAAEQARIDALADGASENDADDRA